MKALLFEMLMVFCALIGAGLFLFFWAVWTFGCIIVAPFKKGRK